MILEIPEDLNCPICMSTFKIPITTQSGHSFCRSCLINSSKTKRQCPMCRQDFQSSPEKLKQDCTLSHILQDLIAHSIRPKKKQDTSFQAKGEPMLLLDIKTEHLLLPYSKIPATFELQSPILLNKCEKLVARQQYPYNKFGVISRIGKLNRLRHNVYECTLEGKSFCLIEGVKEEQGVSETEEEYYYRTCHAKQIVQTSNINLKQFQEFLTKLKQIHDPQIIRKIYEQVDRDVLSNANDPLALVYSIFQIIDIENAQKYRVLTLFDEQKRMEVIRNQLKTIRHDVSFNVQGFIKIRKESTVNYSTLAFFAILFAIIYLFNRNITDGQL